VVGQTALQIALVRRFAHCQEIKGVRVLERLLSELGSRRRQCTVEVGLRFALSEVEIALDLMHQHGPTPPVLDRLRGVPGACRRIGRAILKADPNANLFLGGSLSLGEPLLLRVDERSGGLVQPAQAPPMIRPKRLQDDRLPVCTLFRAHSADICGIV